MSYLDEWEHDDRVRDGRSGEGRSGDDRFRDDRSRDERSRDERPRDGRGAGGRRSTQPARPAWDAATYGTPDDTRRARPPASSRGRGGNPDRGYSDRGYNSDGDSRVGADPYRSTYPAEPFPPSSPYPPVPAEQYPSEGYSSDPGRPLSTYPENLYPAASSAPPYASETYAPDTYSSDKYAADPFPLDSYSSSMYAPDPESDPYGSSAYPSDPYPVSSYSPDPYPANQPSSGSPGFDPYSVAAAPGDRSAGQREQGGGDPAHRYPGGSPDEAGTDAPKPSGRAGRNLPAAVGVGVLLGGIAVGSLFFWRPAFLVVLVAAVGIGSWELVRAIRGTGANPPLIPLLVGGALMMGLAWWGHADALTFGLMVTVLAAMVWRLADGSGNYGRDVTAATLVTVYVPFLAGFAALLATPSDGDLRVLVTLAGVVLSDTGGYVAGVLFGKHAMAPTVSPKKSWEGLAGSLVATGVGGALLLYFLFDVSFGWGAVFGLAVSAAAVLGDLGESMIKRDLGVKDMSQLLPGHGGLMDRMDSIVLAAPTAYVLLVVLAPPL